jgi:YVTN family beta-propeller protein
MGRFSLWLFAFLLGAGLLRMALGFSAAADDFDQLKVGVQPNGRIVVPTNQILEPAGKQITFPGRPVDLALAEEGKILVVKNMRDLVFIDIGSCQIKQTLGLPHSDGKGKSGPGFSVVGLLVMDGKVYASDAQQHVRIAERQADGCYAWVKPIELAKPKVGGYAHPAGLCRQGKDQIWVTATRGNNVQLLNVESRRIEQIVPVGVAPYMICAPRPDRLYVSNWGGDPPRATDPHGMSSGTPVRLDSRTGVANEGTLSVLGCPAGKWTQLKTIPVGLHPSGLTVSAGGRFVYIANANSDTVSVLDTSTDEVVETIACRPERRLPFGSGSNALALSPDGATLYVANGTNNCVAVIRLAPFSRAPNGRMAIPVRKRTGRTGMSILRSGLNGSRVAGLIPTGWYPGAVLLSPDGKRLFVANVKGHGSLSQPRPLKKGKNSHDHLGSVSIIDVPDDAQLARYTRTVNANNRLAYSVAGLERARADAKPVPVPQRHGEPSVFQHVIYIIKENRTYDQVFGDMKEGNGESRLALFGEEVTPNHHALARQFTLFDNFYCSGVLSADGHSWADSAYVTDYLEKAFGGFTRSYPDDGRDPLAFAPTGFLWDNALAHGKSLRNYGEFVAEQPYLPAGTSWLDLYKEHTGGRRKLPITLKFNNKALAAHSHPTYPYFPLTAPDAYRADLFLEEFRSFEKKGELPNLLYMSLPCDHTAGTKPGYPTPRAMVSDNDLALGRIVEAVSHSKFWRTTCILVVEDDPQNGFDHVDGHRTVALAISPYTKRKYVDHTQYNQTGMVKTVELLLGLPPMNQLDLSATPMRNCFQSEADLTSYACVPNRIALDEMNPALKKLTGKARYWAEKSLALDLEEADRADEDTFNRILWHATRGYDTPYPEEYAGSRVDD